MNELTPEQKQDIQERSDKFIEGYKKLADELQMDFGQYPQYVPLGNGLYGTMIYSTPRDKKYLPTPVNPSDLV